MASKQLMKSLTSFGKPKKNPYALTLNGQEAIVWKSEKQNLDEIVLEFAENSNTKLPVSVMLCDGLKTITYYVIDYVDVIVNPKLNITEYYDGILYANAPIHEYELDEA